MRKKFVECSTEAEAIDACPWACTVIEADGGFWCFESDSDAVTWSNQK